MPLWNRRMFPGTNLQDLNLDWILRKIAALRGGSTGQYLYKKSDNDFDFGWKSGGGGGGGTSDYIDLDNKPSINNVELVGNKTASDLGLASASDIPQVPVQSVNGETGNVVLSASDVGAYVKPEEGIPKTDFSSAVQASLDKAETALQAVPPTYRTASAQDTIDAAQDAQIAYVVNGAQSSVTIPAEKYVIIRNNGNISDGLYITTESIPADTNITTSMLSAVQNGGLNALQPISLGGTAGTTAGNARNNLEVPHCIRYFIGANETINLFVSGTQQFLLFTIGSVTSKNGFYIIGKVSSNEATPAITPVVASQDLTITASAAQITIGNTTSGTAYIIVFTYPKGNLPTIIN